MRTKIFWFHIHSDNEQHLDSYNELDNIPESTPIEFEIPNIGKRLYIVNECMEYKPVWYINIDDNTDYKNVYLKIFSQFHGSLPFSWYGIPKYPEIPAEIGNMQNIITEEEIEKIDNDIDGFYFVFVIDSSGEEIFKDMLLPLIF